jgi:proline-specific peptidase
MNADEGYIEVPGARVWYRAVGEQTEAIPLLCLHGGPGFTHYYLEPLEALAEHRRVIFYDQLGCGRSDQPDDLSLWTVDRFVGARPRKAAPVRQFLGRHARHAVHPGPPA